MKAITEMTPIEYALFMKGRGIDIDEIRKKSRKKKPLSEAERFFSQSYQQIAAVKNENPQEYERLAAQLEKERRTKE